MTGIGPTLAGGTGLEGALSGGSGVAGGGIPVPVLANVTSITHTGLDGANAMVIDPTGNYLLVVSDQQARLTCVDISDRENPSVANVVTDLTNIGTCYSICLDSTGDIAWVGGGSNKLAKVDVSALPTMTILGSTTNTSWSVTYNLRMLGANHVVLPALNDDRLNLVTNLANPSSLTVADFANLDQCRWAEVKDDRWVYAANSVGVTTYDCADPTNILTTQAAATLGFGPTYGLAFYNNKSYLVSLTHGTSISGMRVMDLSTPGSPAEIAGSAINYAVTSAAGCQTIVDQYSFAAWGGTTLRAHDLSPISSNAPIQLVDDLELPYATSRNIVWHDNYIYITGPGNDRLMVVSTT